MMNKKLTKEDLTRIMNEEIAQQEANRQRTGTGNPFPAREPGEFNGTALIRLKVADVDPYEDNPRQAPNAKFQEIKDSIRARGLDQRLIVTKRPGAQRYILAKGGKTRLQALQELAQEDKKFEAIDFELVKYESESELLVAHMVENHQHETMTFWDTASGFLLLRSKRSKELQRTVSNREFAEELKKLGFKVDNHTLGEYEFLHQVLNPLGNLARTMGPGDVRNTIRPQFNAIFEISRALGRTERSTFEAQYRLWLERYVASTESQFTGVEDVPAVREVKFDTAGFVRHIHCCAAEFLNLTPEALAAAQAAVSKNRKIDGPGLHEAIEAAKNKATSEYAPASDAADVQVLANASPREAAAYQGTHTQDANDIEVAANSAIEKDAAGGNENDQGAAQDQAPAGSDEKFIFGDSARIPDGLSGVSPVPKHLVHTLVPLDANGKPIHKDAQAAANDGGNSAPSQADLPGTTSVEQAAEEFQQAVESLCVFAGIQELIRPAPAMPLTFFMELPERPLGVDPFDYAVQAWWFMANISGQFSQHHYQASYKDEGGTEVYALYDTGPKGFRQLAANESAFLAFVQSHLGGVYQSEAFHMLNIMSDPRNAMGELAREVLITVAKWRLHRGA